MCLYRSAHNKSLPITFKQSEERENPSGQQIQSQLPVDPPDITDVSAQAEQFKTEK